MSNLPQTAHDIEPAPSTNATGHRFTRWNKRVLSFCLVAFALEIGLFLTIYPWSGTWSLNFIPIQVTALLDIWNSPALRAAISGLGLVNIWIAAREFLRLLRGSSIKQKE